MAQAVRGKTPRCTENGDAPGWLAAAILVWIGLAPAAAAQEIPHPTDYFGFEIGADGELARYPRILEYLQLLANRSERVGYERRGTTTLGNPYVLATFSSPANLARLDRLIAINHRLNDPRGLSETEALALAREGVPFYFLYATIHSTEVGNTQTLIKVAHRLATDTSPEIGALLDDVVLLMVPSQNPDGQVLVIDHWYDTQGTGYNRTYPDLYHHYTGHDDNRDWFMFTQTETRLALDIHREFKPQVTHDMHQMGSNGARIFVPPYQDPHDLNIHPLLLDGQARIGMAMAGALLAEDKGGVVYGQQYDLWAPARQYMVYHGQPRILTEIASARLADPYVNPAGADFPLGPQDARVNFPLPYEKGVWRLGDIVDYGYTAVFAALDLVAKTRTTWMENYYRVHRDWVERDTAPYAFAISADQRDPFATYELLELLQRGEVEIDQARTAFIVEDRRYPAGSWVIRLAQPAGTTRNRMEFGLDPQQHDESWRWAFGVGDAGWRKLAQWVRDGGTLVALGSAVGTARELLDLPIEPVLTGRSGRPQPAPSSRQREIDGAAAELREAFQSPAQLLRTLRDEVVEPTSLFYCPGSLLKQEFNPSHPVAFGMPERWPVFFRFDQAYRLTPSFDIAAETVSRYPDEDDMVASGWLLGGELLRNQANVVSFTVGRGAAVTFGSQIAFRTQTRGTFKLLFNAIFQGSAETVDAAALGRLE